MLIQRCINVVQRCFDVVSMSGSIVVSKLENRGRILFHFQRRINVISTLFQRWSTRLRQRWFDAEMLAGKKKNRTNKQKKSKLENSGIKKLVLSSQNTVKSNVQLNISLALKNCKWICLDQSYREKNLFGSSEVEIIHLSPSVLSIYNNL